MKSRNYQKYLLEPCHQSARIKIFLNKVDMIGSINAVSKSVVYYFILINVIFFLTSFIPPVSKTLPVTVTLKSAASFPIGTATDATPIQNNSLYSGVLFTEFNSVTCESAMEFDRVEWAPGSFNFSMADSVVTFAQQHNQRVHGHTLIWHDALPNWVVNFTGDSAAWENIFKNHIIGMVSHYKGKVASWDVVNEAIRDDDGTLINQDYAGPGSGSLWRQHLGSDYIARAFQYAHAADPNAILFYNDYGNDNGGWNDTKLNALLALVANLKSRNIPIGGIGIQMHINIRTDNSNIAATLRKMAATGLKIHISELDISVNPTNNPGYFPYNPNIIYTDSLQNIQADKFQFIAEIYQITVPPAQRFGITVWEFSDAYCDAAFDKLKDWPLLFDNNYQKKATYYGFLKGLQRSDM
jgi:endo-1,4-beta-xylanase